MLAVAIKKGNLRGFDQALAEGEDEFIKRRIYLTLERGRDIALRNLLRKVYLAGGFIEVKEGEEPARRTRIPVAEFAAAMNISGGEDLDIEEVECLLANMIYKVRHPILFKSFSTDDYFESWAGLCGLGKTIYKPSELDLSASRRSRRHFIVASFTCTPFLPTNRVSGAFTEQ
jgi:hypothetical protein